MNYRLPVMHLAHTDPVPGMTRTFGLGLTPGRLGPAGPATLTVSRQPAP